MDGMVVVMVWSPLWCRKLPSCTLWNHWKWDTGRFHITVKPMITHMWGDMECDTALLQEARPLIPRPFQPSAPSLVLSICDVSSKTRSLSPSVPCHHVSEASVHLRPCTKSVLAPFLRPATWEHHSLTYLCFFICLFVLCGVFFRLGVGGGSFCFGI